MRKATEYCLTERQKEVLLLIAQGLTEQAVAYKLNLSKNTVKYHKKVVFQKLKVRSVIEAIIKALKIGLISVQEINV